jgi:hypothetical protein
MQPGKTRSHNRHNIPTPASGVTVTATGTPILTEKAFLDGFKERIHELFLTLPGLPGHVVQVQQEFNRLSNSTLDDPRKKEVGDAAFEQIVKAAEHCSIVFAQQTFRIPSIQREYVILRTAGGVKHWKTVMA